MSIEPGLGSNAASWVLKHPAPFLTIVGAILYALLWAVYAMFYGEFGVTPEEVGIDYMRLVRQAAAFLLLASIAGTAVYMGMKILVYLMVVPLVLLTRYVWSKEKSQHSVAEVGLTMENLKKKALLMPLLVKSYRGYGTASVITESSP